MSGCGIDVYCHVAEIAIVMFMIVLSSVRASLRPGDAPSWSHYLPGVVLCATAAAFAMAVSHLLRGVSPLICAIALGVSVTNAFRLPETVAPGVALAAKRFLRLGIVLLGLKMTLATILGLGAPMLLVIVAVVAGGIAGTMALGRFLKVGPTQSLLIGCGFSICGAAAVAGAESVTDAEEEDVVAAVALVVVFGTVMIPVVALLGPALGMDPEQNGLWAGASVHEMAQVIAAGGLIGGGALGVAVVTKLARILMLAPVVVVLGHRQRRLTAATPGRRPPIVPPFIVGFVALAVLRSAGDVPSAVLGVGSLMETALLTAAMFGLGCSVRIRTLARIGVRPCLLAAASTAWVAVIALVGITVISM